MVSRQGHEQLAGSSFRPVKISLFEERGERFLAEQKVQFYGSRLPTAIPRRMPTGEKPGVSEEFGFLLDFYVVSFWLGYALMPSWLTWWVAHGGSIIMDT